MGKIDKLIQQYCPKGVEYKSLSVISDRVKGMTGVTNKWADEGNCHFIDYLNVFNHLKVDTSLRPFATVKKLEQTSLRIGDILITSASETPEECAISAVIEDEITDNTFLDDHLFGIRINDEYKNLINPSFVNYYFHSIEFRNILPKAVRGVTRFYISLPDFMELKIPVPPLPVQEEIVRILDKITELEAELEAEMVIRKQQYEYYKDKILSLSEYKGEIIEISLKDVCHKIGDGLHGTPEYQSGTNYYFINGNNLNSGHIEFYGAKTVSQESYENILIDLNNHTLLMSINGTLGNLAFYNNEKITLGKSVAYFIVNESVLDVRYLFYLLQTENVTSKLFSQATGSTIKNLGLGAIREFKIKIPRDLYEQNRIVSILNVFFTLTENTTEGIPAEIEMRHQQYEYYRDKLLTFERL